MPPYTSWFTSSRQAPVMYLRTWAIVFAASTRITAGSSAVATVEMRANVTRTRKTDLLMAFSKATGIVRVLRGAAARHRACTLVRAHVRPGSLSLGTHIWFSRLSWAVG